MTRKFKPVFKQLIEDGRAKLHAGIISSDEFHDLVDVIVQCQIEEEENGKTE